MNFKSLIYIVFSCFIFSCFSFPQGITEKEILYNPEGIRIITKTFFQDKTNDKNITEQLCFAEGLTRFCKEKGIQEGDPIAKIKNIHSRARNDSTIIELKLHNFALPQEAIFFDIIVKPKGYDNIIERDVLATQAMKQFIKDMIEKGKSVNQAQASN